MARERQLTKTFQVNHLAPLLLTTLLLDRLIESRARVLNTSSVGNKIFGRVDINDLDAAGKHKIGSANKQADDSDLARQLWERSETMTAAPVA